MENQEKARLRVLAEKYKVDPNVKKRVEAFLERLKRCSDSWKSECIASRMFVPSCFCVNHITNLHLKQLYRDGLVCLTDNNHLKLDKNWLVSGHIRQDFANEDSLFRNALIVGACVNPDLFDNLKANLDHLDWPLATKQPIHPTG